MQKVKDLCVKTGSYTGQDGTEKGRYENVGALWEGQDGQFLTLKRTFNPAGAPFRDGKDSIVLSLFDPRDNQQGGQQRAQQPQQQPSQGRPQPSPYAAHGGGGGGGWVDDGDIPF